MNLVLFCVLFEGIESFPGKLLIFQELPLLYVCVSALLSLSVIQLLTPDLDSH